MSAIAPHAEEAAYEAVCASAALKSCGEYLRTTGVNSFSGRAFGISYGMTPDEISEADLEALKTLRVARNVNVSRQSAEFGRRPQINRLLSCLPDTPIRSMTDYIIHSETHPKNQVECCAWGLADSLWYEVGQVNQFGRYVVRSKLLARKRPNLFPIYDDFVGRALGIGTNKSLQYSLWGTFQAVTQSDRVWTRLTEIQGALLNEYANDRCLEGLTPLRILDIILWMRFRK